MGGLISNCGLDKQIDESEKKMILPPDKRLTGLVFVLCGILLLAGCAPELQQYNLGVGEYPGAPSENFAPSMKIDSTHYRNLALFRPAYQSSSYDFNLTSQLITDGIIDTTLPGWIVTTTSMAGIIPKIYRQMVLDRHNASKISLDSSTAWLQIEMAGKYQIPAIDSISVSGNVLLDSTAGNRWSISVSGSENGVRWQRLGAARGRGLPGHQPSRRPKVHPPMDVRVFNYRFRLDSTVQFKYYRLDVNSPNARKWSIGIFGFFYKGRFAKIGGPYHFTNAWKSAGSGKEWVYVDLGSLCCINDVKLFWIRAALEGRVYVSDDAKNWREVAPLPSAFGNVVNIELPKETKARYVKVLMTKPADPKDGYILNQIEVFGRGGPEPVQHPQASINAKGRISLAGGSWRLQRASLVDTDGIAVSQSTFNDSSWLIATVPGTILTSYLDDGAIPNPNYADNQAFISDSYFYSNFWYRDVFTPPPSFKGKRMYLNFDGVNWEAEVYLDGRYLGDIKGAFIRGRFDVTNIVHQGRQNVLAVLIRKNSMPGFPKEPDRYSTQANGGQLGADNPTFEASVGWDWIPTVRGRDTGIWNKVYLSVSGPVTIRDPFVWTHVPVPDTTTASVYIQVTLHNHEYRHVEGVLRGELGQISFETPVSLNPNALKTITLDPTTNPDLELHDPKLWWPNGYGAQNLYKVKLEFVAEGQVSDSKSIETGVRELTYSEKGGALRIWVNGRRFIAHGGNWGFPESMLRYRKREYDIAVRLHKDMNFTMIRNWVGQTANMAFYKACDKYGIMVWQDFWLANPNDAPNPIHVRMFLKNMYDYVERIRSYPCVALFVGRNEGYPPKPLDDDMPKLLAELDSGVKYIPNSAEGPVSGRGPYRLMPIRFYFKYRATKRLHSEMGMPAIVSYASLCRMMPKKDIWPQSDMWGIHDFTLGGSQNGASFDAAIRDHFGVVDSLREWLWLADYMEYCGYRAMFESQAKNRMGLLIWMSHPAWPCLTFQTYDYYFDPTAGYFGCKEGCQPLHIQWNPVTDSIEVVNYSVENGSDLNAIMEIKRLDGRVVLKEEKSDIDCPEDSAIDVFRFVRPDSVSKVYFIELRLERGKRVISRNLYWREVKDGDMKLVLKIPGIKLFTHTVSYRKGKKWILTTTLRNETEYPAPIIKLKVVGNKDGRRILPVIFSDNFITLLPGEQRTIKMRLNDGDTRGERPKVVVEGLNIL